MTPSLLSTHPSSPFHPQLSFAASSRLASFRFLVAAVGCAALCLAVDFVDSPFTFDARMLQHQRIHFRLLVPFLTSFSCLLLSALLPADKSN
jgi:hypothetical protein